MNTERANVVSRGECGKCGSSDGNVLYDNGSRYCFVCETYTAAEGSDKLVSVTERKVHTMNTPLSQGQFSAIEDRGISLEAAKAYGITVAGDKQIYPYYDVNGQHVANKVRHVKTKEAFT